MSTFIDYYELLGIPVDASPALIKGAFKKLALQYHPDVYKGEDAQERMRVLLLAYKTLSNPQERRAYDAQHSEHFLDSRAAYIRHTPPSQEMRRPTAPSARHPASAENKHEPQRHFAFPRLLEAQPSDIDLVDYLYRLSATEADTLREQGLLRGVAAADGDASEGRWYCHRCHHRWQASANRGSRNALPPICPRCHGSDWSEYLLLRCIHCTAVFESEQIRYEIGSLNYGKKGLCPPYELFPLCPHCGAERWCPAENTRVEELRKRQARRPAWRKFL